MLLNNEIITSKKLNQKKDWDRRGLPPWSYTSPEMLALEKVELFRKHWQLICHSSDIPNVGDFITCDIVGERALVIRDSQGKVNGFHNLCRHRGSRVLGSERGTCKSAIVCPFHGWTYNFDGSLRGPSQPKSFPKMDYSEWGLKPLECELWNGFIFVRFNSGPQASVKEIFGRFDEELSQYNLSGLESVPNSFWTEVSNVNWKCIRDVDNEGYHVPMAHPGLHDLFGDNYFDEPFLNGASRSFSKLKNSEGHLWSVKKYQKILPDYVNLDNDHKRSWLYIAGFPNFVIDVYPDSVNFYQEFPIEVGKTLQRGAFYKFPNEGRRGRAARYISGRIDRITSKEDVMLSQWSWEATFSSAYDGVILSDLEQGVRSYHDALRCIFPVLLDKKMSEGSLEARNNELLKQTTLES
jgi:phenylpropionate dioxygenase-like ring-hydroxylating dioxygenase large terminal subunit